MSGVTGVVGISRQEDLLLQLNTQTRLLLNGRPCVGVQTLSVTDSVAVSLTPSPINAQAAMITVEASSSQSNTSKVLRFWENGSTPTTTVGVLLGNLDKYEILNSINIQNFKVIGIESGLTHTLTIQYYL